MKYLRFPDQHIKGNIVTRNDTEYLTKFYTGNHFPRNEPIYHFWLKGCPLSCTFHSKMVSLQKSHFFASLQTALNATSLSFSFFLNCMNRYKNNIFSLHFVFLILPFGSFSQPFIYAFNIKIANLQYTWNLSYPFRAKPVTVYAIILVGQEPITWSLHLPYKPLESTLSDEKLFIETAFAEYFSRLLSSHPIRAELWS